MEIILGQVDRGTAFSNERSGVTQFANRGVQLMAVPGSKPDAWNAGFGEGFQKLREPCQWFACKRNEVVNGAVDDRVRRTQKDPQTGSPIVSKIG
jgi:hypothetical protein